MILLADLQSLYDRNRFLEAFRQSAGYWNSPVRLEDLSLEELILGGRLAARLGGRRLSRRLFRAAFDRNPSDPRVHYYTLGIRRRAWLLFDELRSWEANAEIPGADSDTQASWLATQGVSWASLRDFTRAHACIERARSFQTSDGWVSSCESDVFGLEDRWGEALNCAELAWEMKPGTPFAAHSLGTSLLNLRRIREAAERLAAAADNCESFEVAHLACWHLCALAETIQGDERGHVMRRAEELADQLSNLAPLADRETRAQFARIRLDIAEMEDDHVAMERWANEIHSPFHRIVLENLRKNPSGLRIRLPFRRAIQKHEACLPTSISSSLAAMGIEIDPDVMASEITFGGTQEWAAAQWLEKRGLEVRFFPVVPEVAVRLVKNGFAFVMTLEADASAHAVAVVGLDEAAGTLIIHDPQALRATEYLLSSIGKNETPLGPRGMVIIPQDNVALLDQLLPQPDVEAATAVESHRQAFMLRGAVAAREIVAKLTERQPSHPITRMLKAVQAIQNGQVGLALVEFQDLIRMYPGSAFVRARLLSCCRSLGDTALMRSTLASVVESGMLPGIQSQQDWLYPPSAYVSEYADLLRASTETRNQARSLLHGVIRRESSCAQAWHILGDLLWEEHDIPGSLLAYRIAACLAGSNEHYARAYCDALGHATRKEEGLQWLEDRVRTSGASPQAIATWITWISALEDWGDPERALATSEDALKNRGNSSDLLAFVVPFLARMGRWQEAGVLLNRLEAAGNSALFHEAASDFHRRRGALQKSLVHAEAWVNESPLSMPARRELLNLIAKRDGARAALERATEWLADHPGHDEMEQLYCQYLDQTSSPRWKKYSLLRRRAKRNPEDGWTWRELAFTCISDYESKDGRRREKLQRSIEDLIAQCDRTAPDDAATLRARAQWCEARGDWTQAIDLWLESINREPNNSHSYRQIWDCLARSNSDQRKQSWQNISTKLISYSGRLCVAREAIMLAAQRFGVAEAEKTASTWQENRPDDPEVTEAHTDLLLDHGHGRTDTRRALEMLQPAVERFPFHFGLRFSLAVALRKLGNFKEAGEVLTEIIRRHPDNSPAQIQLARVHERNGDVNEAFRILASAASLDTQNADIRDVQAQILIATGRHEEARATIHEALLQSPENVHWRERAIRLFVDCGDKEAAVQAAREGVRVYPRGAYLWFLLGRTLNEMRHFAAQGEIESCLRRSLSLNQGLFLAADPLAMLLVEQRQYIEAEDLMLQIRDRLSDPSPAMGRLAWIHREKGDKSAAREEMISLLRATPWYSWGWSVLVDWLSEDKAWNETRSALGSVPPELATNVQFRRQRLNLLEQAGLSAAELDSEWNSLLRDFPEDISLHLLRYDSLQAGKRFPEAAAVLEVIRPVTQENPYFLARFVEVLAGDPKQKDQTIESLMRIFFAETEESLWPADYAWKAVQSAHLEEIAYQKALSLFRQGAHPTLRALSILASHAATLGKTEKRNLQPIWRTWLSHRGARELIAMLKILDAATWSRERHRATVLKQLSDLGYSRLVVRYWKRNKEVVEADVDSWAQTGRALVNLNRKSEARKLLGRWRERAGVGMWVLANYVLCLSALRPKELRETHAACRDALAGLSHDQCAKYLVHRQAEACALLGDTKAFSETYNEYRNYFDGKLGTGEWFEARRKHLIDDLPAMARLLEANDPRKYGWKLWGLRWKRFSRRLKSPTLSGKKTNLRWTWILFWLLWLLFQYARNR
jgi:tetratricopeptide (TPR) repeat protein